MISADADELQVRPVGLAPVLAPVLAGGGRPARIAVARPANLFGASIDRHPRIKDAPFRLTFPAYVAHFKGHAGLAGSLRRRRDSGLSTPQAAAYTESCSAFWMTARPRLSTRRWWPARAPGTAAPTGARAAAPGTPPHRAAPRAAEGWRLRQLTHGTEAGCAHSHGYYDIPVTDAEAGRIAAIRSCTPYRNPNAGDRNEVGVIDLAEGGFRPLAETSAWSWQQGPMLQWLPNGRLVWNIQDGDRFCAMTAAADGTDRRQ